MPTYQTLQWSLSFTWLAFAFAFGAIVGSFLNVIVYRLPAGMGIVRPPSACPHCNTLLTWRENIPILGWIILRGRCKFCRSPISGQYPLIEFLVALLFSGIFAAWLMDPSLFSLLGVDVDTIKPDWARNGLERMWPALLLIFAMLGSLVAITLIDARTFMIPLALPWFITICSFILHPLHALWVQMHAGSLHYTADGAVWTIPTPSWPWLAAGIAGVAGIAASIAMLQLGIFPRSFSDYEEWEKRADDQQKKAADDTGSTEDPASNQLPVKALLLRTFFLTGPAIAGMFLGYALGLAPGFPLQGTAIGLAIGLIIGIFLRRLVTPPSAHIEPMWVQYPHARREMLKEFAFLLPCIVLASLAWIFAHQGPFDWSATNPPPLWMQALGGSMLGYLVGGGTVWGVRIGGSLAFGKEAMGLGDVHLMAGVGACLGWIDPILAFFTAPFLGLTWAAGSVFLSGIFRREGTAMPYGPHLAAATVLVLLLKPIYEGGLGALLGHVVDLP